MKNAQIQVSFNWIFILIAGAGILAIFIIIIANQTSSSETRTDIRTTERFSTILTSIETTQQTSKELDTMNAEIHTKCEEGVLRTGVKDGNYETTLGTTEIFMPQTIGNSKLITWTQNYEMPYPITTLLSISDKKTRYIFINSTLTRKYYTKTPEEFEKTLMNKNELNTLNPESYRKYIMITDETTQLTVPNSIKLKTNIIQIKNNQNFDGTGTIKILNFTNIQSGPGSPVEIQYISETMLQSMIISADPQIINCTLKNINQKTRIISQVNINRTNKIHKEYDDIDSLHRCKVFYEETTLDAMKKLIAATKEENYDKIKIAAKTIQRINQNIERASCTELY